MRLIHHLIISQLYSQEPSVQTFTLDLQQGYATQLNFTELNDCIREVDYNGLSVWLIKNSNAITPRDRHVIYTKVSNSKNSQLFSILLSRIEYSDNRLIMTIEMPLRQKILENYSRVILRFRPHLLSEILAVFVRTHNYLAFLTILKEYIGLLDEDNALSLYFCAISRNKHSFIRTLISTCKPHTRNLANEIFILSVYKDNLQIAADILENYDISDNAVICAYGNANDINAYENLTIGFIKRIRHLAKNTPHNTAPVFEKIQVNKFLKLHNSILLHNGLLYRIKYHLTTLPFAPPYTIVFDLAEMASTINLHELFFWKPLNSISSSFIYQADSYDGQTYRKAHSHSYTEFSQQDHSFLTMFIELEPIEGLPSYPMPDIWELNKQATDFNLIHRDERFPVDSSKGSPPESDESDQDDFLSPTESIDSTPDTLSPNDPPFLSPQALVQSE